MTNLKLVFAKKGSEQISVVIPIQSLHVGIKYIPKDVRVNLDKLGIQIDQSADLAKDKALTGTLIAVETPTLKLSIAVE